MSTPIAFQKRKKGFTLIEVLVVILIIVIFMGLSWTELSGAINQAKQTKCASNMRQLGIAASLYSQDNKYRVVPVLQYVSPTTGFTWIGFLSDYLPVSTTSLACPAVPAGPGVDLSTTIGENPNLNNVYSLNGQSATNIVGRLNNCGNLSQRFLFIDCSSYAVYSWIPPVFRHRGGANLCFLDGHVEWRQGQLPPPPEASNNEVVTPPW